MGKRDKRVDAYISKAADFAKPVLKEFRATVHEACPEVEETIKWGMPFFMYHGMLCNMAAFKQHCAMGFWKGSMIFGTKQGEGGAMGNFGRVTSLKDLPPKKELIKHLKEGARLNEEGIKKPKLKAVKKELVVPDFFMKAVKKNKKALATFDGFPYSHKKEYVEWVCEAKTDETRDRRLATTVDWLAEGKSRNWKYEKC